MLVNVAMFSPPTQYQTAEVERHDEWSRPRPEFGVQFILRYKETTQHARKRSVISFGKMGYLDQILNLIVQCCNAIWLWDQDVTDSERSEVTLQPFNLYDRAVMKKKNSILGLIFIIKSVCFGATCIGCLAIFCGQNLSLWVSLKGRNYS